MLGQQDPELVPILLEEALRLKPELKDRRTVAWLLIFEGGVALTQGDLERTKALGEESLALFREIKDIHGTAGCLNNLGLLEVARGNYERASAMLRENLRSTHELGDKTIIQYALWGLGFAALHQGRPARAARLWAAAEAVRETFGIQLSSLGRAHSKYDDLLAETSARLGDAAFDEAWAEGKAMPQEKAVEYALGEEGTVASAAPEEPAPRGLPEVLTRRERQIAILVARGLTNRQISSELSISERTVHNHVRKVLKKLGLSSRTQVAAWATERRLGATEQR